MSDDGFGAVAALCFAVGFLFGFFIAFAAAVLGGVA